MSKQIIVLHLDKSETILDKAPNYDEMKKIIGGYLEHVRVLDRIENGRFIYTSMFVDEEGLLKGLPKNPKATELYQRNVRAQYAYAAKPFEAASRDWKEMWEKRGAKVIDGTISSNPELGFDPNNPHIAGIAIFFEGYTCEEVNAIFEE